jgi:hypothetical protein
LEVAVVVVLVLPDHVVFTVLVLAVAAAVLHNHF